MVVAYMATGDALVGLSQDGHGWTGELLLDKRPAECLATDPSRPACLYCGTFGEGLLRSVDAGASWERLDGIPHAEVTAVAVNPLTGAVWAGTEPSSVFSS